MIDKDIVMSKMSDLQESFEELQVILREDARSIIDNHLKFDRTFFTIRFDKSVSP